MAEELLEALEPWFILDDGGGPFWPWWIALVVLLAIIYYSYKS